jgi:hypothetical protein
MATQNILAHSGNLIALELDGKRFGTIRTLRANDDYAPEPLSGIGDIHVQEYVPSMARHSLSVDYMVIKTDSLRKAGLLDENGCARLQGMEFDITIYEKNPTAGSGGNASQASCEGALTELRKYRYCSMASGSVNVQAHQIVVSDATFNARDVVGKGI